MPSTFSSPPSRPHRARIGLRAIAASLAFTAALLGSPWTAQAAPACPPQAAMPSAAQIEAGMRNARDRGFLWRITKDGRTSHLYGTLHIGKADWAYPGPTVVQAVKASDAIALEIDLQDPTILQRMRTGMANWPRVKLPGPMAQRLQAQTRKACLPAQVEQALTPEMLASTLIVLSLRNDGLDPAYGIDAVLGGISRSLKKKPPHALETPELQLSLLHGRTPEESQRMVEQSLTALEGPALRRMMLRLSEAWSEGRHDELSNYTNWCDCTKTALDRELLRRMLDGRNPALADSIDALHARGEQVFAAVGALHMVGTNGLPALMAQRGYQVEPVAFPR